MSRNAITGSYGTCLFRVFFGLLVFCFVFMKSPNFSRVAVPFYIPTSNVWAIQFLHIFASILAILIRMSCYLIVVFIYISVLSIDSEHIFMCFFVICKSSLLNYFFVSFAHFINIFFLSFEILVLGQLCIFKGFSPNP